MLKTYKPIVLVAFTGLALATSAFGADSSIFAGVEGGAGFFNSNLGTNFTIGVDGGYKITPEVSFGAYAAYSSLGSIVQTSSGVTVTNPSSSLWAIMAEGQYWLKDIGPGTLHFGADVGLGIVSTSYTLSGVSSSTSTTNFGVGPTVGYDYSLGGGLSVDGTANYLIFTSSPNTTNVFNLMAGVRYWF